MRIYKLAKAPELSGTLGVERGVYAGPKPGQVAEDRFCGLTGVGTDADGNVYVSSNGRGPYGIDNGLGAKLQKFNPAGHCLWTLEGLEFVDSADMDPADESSIYTKDSRYRLDYGIRTTEGWPHAGWSHQAWTINPFKYPNDPRLHTVRKGCVWLG